MASAQTLRGIGGPERRRQTPHWQARWRWCAPPERRRAGADCRRSRALAASTVDVRLGPRRQPVPLHCLPAGAVGTRPR